MPTLRLTGSPHFVKQEALFYSTWKNWRMDEFPLKSVPAGLSLNFAKEAQLDREIPEIDIWYQIGGHGLRNRYAAFDYIYSRGIPILVRWLGSDVLSMKDYFDEHPDARIVAQKFSHCCAAPWLVNELKEIGIDAEWRPMSSNKRQKFLDSKVRNLPTRFSVLAYIPDGKEEFYGWKMLERLATEFSEISFVVCSGTGSDLECIPENVQFKGWCEDMKSLYDDCTVLIRMTKHDGYASSVQEASLLGRHVIWTYPFAGARLAHDYVMLRDHFSDLLLLHDTGQLAPNVAGRDFVAHHIRPKDIWKRARESFESMILAKSSNRTDS